MALARRRSRAAVPPIAKLVICGVLIVTTVVSLFPMFWMLSTAFTPGSATIKAPPSLIPVSAELFADGSLPGWVQARAYVPTLANFTDLVRHTQ